MKGGEINIELLNKEMIHGYDGSHNQSRPAYLKIVNKFGGIQTF